MRQLGAGQAGRAPSEGSGGSWSRAGGIRTTVTVPATGRAPGRSEVTTVRVASYGPSYPAYLHYPDAQHGGPGSFRGRLSLGVDHRRVDSDCELPPPRLLGLPLLGTHTAA